MSPPRDRALSSCYFISISFLIPFSLQLSKIRRHYSSFLQLIHSLANVALDYFAVTVRIIVVRSMSLRFLRVFYISQTCTFYMLPIVFIPLFVRQFFIPPPLMACSLLMTKTAEPQCGVHPSFTIAKVHDFLLTFVTLLSVPSVSDNQ